MPTYDLTSGTIVHHFFFMALTNHFTEIFIRYHYIQTYSTYPNKFTNLESLDPAISLILSMLGIDFLLIRNSRNGEVFFSCQKPRGPQSLQNIN